MEVRKSEIRIYVACLASYNNGILHGRWVNAILGEDHMWEETKAMLSASPVPNAEEYEVHDVEGFEGAYMSGNHDFACISKLAEFIEKHGELGAKLIAYFGDLDDARDAMSDHYAGEYERLEDYAEELTDQTTEIPENLRYYIDYEKMARDLAINDVMTIETGHSVRVFWRF